MPEADIHPSAIVSPRAKLGAGVKIGPYAVIHDRVEIGADTTIGPHVVIYDFVRLGIDNRVHAHAVLGDLPQDISFDSARETWVEVGDANTLREGVTIHRSSSPSAATRLGSNSYMMAYSHLGHDCTVGDHVIITINSTVGGHVEIGDHAVLGGSVAVHQFCRIGRYAMVAGFIAVRRDVLPYTMIAGDPARHYRLNSVGLRRSGIKGERYRVLEQAYRALRSGDRSLLGVPATDEVEYLRAWLARDSKRGLSGFVQGKRLPKEARDGS
jgi:UDP-N-acetylglucosamine acyltransferase